MNLLVPVHCAVILERVVVLPVLLELLFLHFGLVSQLLVLVLVLQLQNLILAVNAVFVIHVLHLFLLWEQHEGARQELVPNLQHLVRGEDLPSLLHLVLAVKCNQLSNGVGLVLICTLLVIVEERGSSTDFLPLDDLLVLIGLDLDDEEVLAAHALLVHLARIGLQHVVQVPPVEASVELLLLVLGLLVLIITALFVLVSILVVLLLSCISRSLLLDVFHLGNGSLVACLLS